MTETPEIALTGDDRLQVVELFLLRQRLKADGETELLGRIEICQKELKLKCLTCGSVKTVRQRCKRRWCPYCAKQLAAARATELEYMVERMRHPLFVTLTMLNTSTICFADIRKIRRAFGKLRHRKLWKSRTHGGVFAVEITNIGNGWHVHLHAVIDCEWLAWSTPAPYRSMPRENKKLLYKAAAQELEATWSKLLGQPTSSIRIKRANKGTIAKEVAKYTVKNEDLVTCEGSVGDMIRAMDGCRMMGTFGSLHGQKSKDIKSAAKEFAKVKRSAWHEEHPRDECCGDPDFMPETVTITDKERRLRRQGRLVCSTKF